ncbi:B3/4 domain-containing protein [Streptomyces sp. NBC_00083]|uniref:B3/B4 domain-containing protein n=1 Tax=Streptomyces sp. NBC_00083 TaxID=2975647 RepID=UPI002256F412|nr:phenylalanine--tRNA ligase beta subunit-related protein [Streptomyces sp. NBC_00083]MCX5388052.1 phenylalanine--tRNA ligase beta subunit-related protein [Streptomyces sp. NBC_00083]
MQNAPHTPGDARPLTVSIDPRLTERVPGYVLGLIAVPAIDVVGTGAGPDAVDTGARLTAAEDALHAAGPGTAEVSALPAIAAWREAYRVVGVNPNKYPCAAESVLRRVAKGARLPRINSLVDLCNAVSLASRLPVASCDVGSLQGALEVRPAHGAEVFTPLGSPGTTEHPEPGEVIYADERGRAHSRRWNWRQGDVVRTDAGRRRLLLTVEAAHEGGRAEVEEALARLAAALTALEGLGAAPGHPLLLDRAVPAGDPFAPHRAVLPGDPFATASAAAR